MDFSKYTFWELNKLYWQLGIEYFKRTWWVLLIIIIIVTMVQIGISKKNN